MAIAIAASSVVHFRKEPSRGQGPFMKYCVVDAIEEDVNSSKNTAEVGDWGLVFAHRLLLDTVEDYDKVFHWLNLRYLGGSEENNARLDSSPRSREIPSRPSRPATLAAQGGTNRRPIPQPKAKTWSPVRWLAICDTPDIR